MALGKVLVVDDEVYILHILDFSLGAEGFEVITANNGEEALEILRRGEEISLLVSDVVMPLMDGPTMGREARKDRPGLPILNGWGLSETSPVLACRRNFPRQNVRGSVGESGCRSVGLRLRLLLALGCGRPPGCCRRRSSSAGGCLWQLPRAEPTLPRCLHRLAAS